MSKKILWFDTETTGLDPVQNGIIQLAGMVEIDGKIVDEFDFKMKPFEKDRIDLDALTVHGYSLDKIKNFEQPMEIWARLVQLLSKHCNKFDKSDKLFPAGYNCKFDIDFIAQWFLKCGDKYLGSWINWRAIDPLPVINILSLEGKIDLPNHKLETVCAHFGIEIKAHDALSDIKATREVFLKVKEIIKL